MVAFLTVSAASQAEQVAFLFGLTIVAIKSRTFLPLVFVVLFGHAPQMLERTSL